MSENIAQPFQDAVAKALFSIQSDRVAPTVPEPKAVDNGRLEPGPSQLIAEAVLLSEGFHESDDAETDDGHAYLYGRMTDELIWLRLNVPDEGFSPYTDLTSQPTLVSDRCYLDATSASFKGDR